MLAQREEIAFVQLICFGCQVQTLALITGVDALQAGPDGDAAEAGTEVAPSAGKNGKGKRRPTAPTITEDDVLEMRTFLTGYEGDIRNLLDGGRAGGPGEGSAG